LELKEILYNLFYELTEHPLYEGEIIYVKKYDPGHGMSSGYVAMTWWVMIGIPLLIKRFSERKSPFSGENEFIKKIWPECHKKIMNEPRPNRQW